MGKDKEIEGASVRSRSKANKNKGNKLEDTEVDTSAVSSPAKTQKQANDKQSDKQIDKQKQSDKQSDKPSDKQDKGSQPTLDKHFKPDSASVDFAEVLKTMQENMKIMQDKMSDKLDKLASEEYIEKRFKNMITESVLSQKLQELKTDIRREMQMGFKKADEEMENLSTRVSAMEEIIFSLRNKTSDLEVKNEELEAEYKKVKIDNRKLEETVNDQAVRIRLVDMKNNNLEQYTRRNSIRIYGIEDNISETEADTCKKVLTFMNDKLRIKLVRGDIDIAHRVGKYLEDGNRVIIVKLVQRVAKLDIIRSRRALKGSSYVIREDLTNLNAKLLEAVSEHNKVKSAWSDEGRIIALLKNNRKIVVKQLSDLDFISVEINTGSGTTTLTNGETSTGSDTNATPTGES